MPNETRCRICKLPIYAAADLWVHVRALDHAAEPEAAPSGEPPACGFQLSATDSTGGALFCNLKAGHESMHVHMFQRPASPVQAGPLCADCGHELNDSRFHFEAPGDNWGAALHHFRPASPAKAAPPPCPSCGAPQIVKPIMGAFGVANGYRHLCTGCSTETDPGEEFKLKPAAPSAPAPSGEQWEVVEGGEYDDWGIRVAGEAMGSSVAQMMWKQDAEEVVAMHNAALRSHRQAGTSAQYKRDATGQWYEVCGVNLRPVHTEDVPREFFFPAAKEAP